MSEMLSEQVLDEEFISRFLFTSGEYNSTKVKWQAFKPRNSEVSVMRTTSLCVADIADLGSIVGQAGGRKAKGFATFSSKELRCLTREDGTNLKLDVVAETTFHPRHANIVGFSSNPEDNLEAAKLIAARIQMELNIY